MHEYPITEQIIKICTRHCEENDGERVTKINLVVGDYSGYVRESIQMYFDIIAEGTLCSGAILSMERIKPKLKCSSCGELFEKRPMTFECPKCGGEGGPTEIGKEFYIDSIEIE